MPTLRKAAAALHETQAPPIQEPQQHVDGAQRNSAVFSMDRDDVLNWFMHCTGSGLERFAVHAYEAAVDGHALLTWSDARFAAFGIGAPDFAYTGSWLEGQGAGSDSARAAAHSLDSARLRTAITKLRLAPPLGSEPATPLAYQVSSSAMRLDLGLLPQGGASAACSAAADGRVRWVVQFCRAADQRTNALGATAAGSNNDQQPSHRVPSAAPWPQVCEPGSPMRTTSAMGSSGAEPLEPAGQRGREWGAVWAHNGESFTWLLNLQPATSYAVRALALHCGGARIAGAPSVWRTLPRSQIQVPCLRPSAYLLFACLVPLATQLLPCSASSAGMHDRYTPWCCIPVLTSRLCVLCLMRMASHHA